MNNKGYFEIFDGLMAVILLFTVFLIFNLGLNVPNDSVSTVSHDFRESQDFMEQLSSKVNITDTSFLEDISEVLREGHNSKNSMRMVSSMCEKKFKTLGLEGSYYFTETNHLNGDKIIASGNIDSATNITTASRHCGDYCYVLYVW